MFHDPAPFPVFFIFSIGMGLLVLWIYCLIDAIRNDFEKDSQKIIWIILLVTVPLIGVILYLLMGRDQQIDDLPDEL